MYQGLVRVLIYVTLPQKERLFQWAPEESGLALQSEVSSQLFLNVSVAEEDHVFFNKKTQSWNSDAWKDNAFTWQEITAQLYDYRHILRDLLFKEKVTRFTVQYTADDERFQSMVDDLNTSFSELAYLS